MAVFRQSWESESKRVPTQPKGDHLCPPVLVPPAAGPGPCEWGPCGWNHRQGHTGISSVVPALGWLRTRELPLVTSSSSQGLVEGTKQRGA